MKGYNCNLHQLHTSRPNQIEDENSKNFVSCSFIPWILEKFCHENIQLFSWKCSFELYSVFNYSSEPIIWIMSCEIELLKNTTFIHPHLIDNLSDKW